MKVFLKIWLIILVAAIGSPNSHAQRLYVKKDTTMTFNVSVVDTVSATFNWNISPAISSFVPSTDSIQTVKFSGKAGDVFTLSVIPTGKTGCAGKLKSLDIELYDNNLPINVAWKEDPAPLCPDSGIAASGTIVINNYSGSYSIVYQAEGDSIKTADFNTNSDATITVSKGLKNSSVSAFAYYKVKILRFVTKNVVIAYSEINAPTMTIAVKPVPYIEEIEFK